MRRIDMSREAVTARLKLVSQLRRLCLSLGTAKIKTKTLPKASGVQDHAANPTDTGHHPK